MARYIIIGFIAASSFQRPQGKDHIRLDYIRSIKPACPQSVHPLPLSAMYYTPNAFHLFGIIPVVCAKSHALPLACIFNDFDFAVDGSKHGNHLIFSHFIPAMRLYIMRL